MKDSKKPVTSNHKPATTSWGSVATWYDKHLEGVDTYHTKVIFPNLIRLLGDIKDQKVLDLACGQGIFSRILKEMKADVTGIDIARELIEIAEKKNRTEHITRSKHGSSNRSFYYIDDGKFPASREKGY